MAGITDLYRLSPLSWEQIAERYGMERTALTRKLKKMGLWTSDLDKKKARNTKIDLAHTEGAPRQLVRGASEGRPYSEIYISSTDTEDSGGSGRDMHELHVSDSDGKGVEA